MTELWNVLNDENMKKITKETKEQYNTLLEIIDEGITLSDANSHFEIYNSKMYDITGYCKEEANTCGDFILLLYPDFYEREKALSNLNEVLKNGVSRNFETTIQTKDGTRKTLSVSTSKTRIDDRDMFLSVYRDITKHKRSEDALRKSESLLNETLKLIKVGGWEYDIATQMCVYTDEVYNIYGIPKGRAFKPEEGIQYYHPDDRETIANAFSRAITVGEAYDLEMRFINKQGVNLWVRTIGTPIFEKGKVVKVIGNLMDITERKRVEEKLKNSEMHYRGLFEAARDGILILDGDTGQITEVNAFMIEMLNYSREEFLNRKLWEIGAFKDIEKCKKVFQELQTKGYIRYEDLPLEVKNGRLIDVEFVSNIYEVDHKKVIQCNIRDITERKQVEKERIKQTNLLYAINMIIRDAIKRETIQEVALTALSVAEVLTGSKFGFIGEINKRGLFDTLALKNLGWDACTMQQSNAAKLLQDMEINGFWGRTLKESKSQIVNNPASDPDGVRIPKEYPSIISFLGVPLRYAEKTIGMIALANKEGGYTVDDQHVIEVLSVAFVEALYHKRSEEKLKEALLKIREHQEQLERYSKNLETVNKDLDGFAYSVSHDLRAPLRSISGFSQVLLSDYGHKVDDTMKHYLERINDGSLKMGTLIDDLLDFSRTTRGEIQYKIVDIETIVNNVINEQKTRNPERNIEFIIHDLQKVEADEKMIAVIFSNLIDNAVKYTGRCDNAHIEIGSKKEKDEIQFFVKDNGVGFDIKFKEKLFNAFQRLHSENEFEGSGIGLATVARLVSKHGGRTWAEGEVDKGASFHFALPVKKYI